jgi:FeS assembly SUF system protein
MPEPQKNSSETDQGHPLASNIVEALKGVYDPEIPLNIYYLGLIYKVDITNDGVVNLNMTLTAPGYPVAETFPGIVEQTVESVEGVSEAHVELVWEPPWIMEMMTEEAKPELGLM